MSRRLIRLLTAAPLLAAATVAHAARTDLPDLGNPADQVLSPRDEARIGRELMAQARRHLDLNEDPEIGVYVDRLGARLARHADSRPVGGYSFFVIHAPSINAFAGPGGYIGLHSGLILEAENEAQLASVIAHEIAHVSQRHIARAVAANQRNQFKTLASVFAGILLATSGSGSASEAGQALMTGGLAAEQQRRINYTRSNEYEADRIGIALLARAGYDPSAMVEFFEVLMSSSGAGSQQVPEFLRTHPLSQNRIAEAQNRAGSLKGPGQDRDSLDFQLIRARLRVERSEEPAALYDRWRTAPIPAHETEARARRYGLALLALRLQRPAEAVDRLAELHGTVPDNRHLGLALARARRAAGELDAAIDRWRQVQTLYPESYPVVVTGADLLLAAERPDAAVALVTDYLRSDPGAPPGAWRELARAADAAGRSGHSHEALGEYYARLDRFEQAKRQFEIAREQAAAGSPEAKRLRARIERLEEQRRRQLAENPIGD